MKRFSTVAAPVLLLAAVSVRTVAGELPAVISATDWQRFSVLTSAGPDEPRPDVFRKLKRLVWAEHHVGKGEYSVWNLAANFGTTTMSLQATNNDELLVLYPGKKVIVLNKDGQLYEVKRATETLDRVIARYHSDPVEALKFKESVVYANNLPGSALLGDYELARGSRLLLPKVRVTFDTYHFPFKDFGWGRVSSRFGSRYHPLLKRRKFHEGLDIAKPWGTPVYPARSGKVVEAAWTEGYGMLITIRHSDGATTRYGHLSKIYVKAGDIVQQGRTLIGRVGSTGLSTGPHLHFEVRDKYGRPLNPGAKIGRR